MNVGPVPADASTRSATRAAASGRPSARAAVLMASRRAGRREQHAELRCESFTVELGVGDHDPRTDARERVRVSRLVIGRRARERDEDRGRPGDGQLGTRDRAGATDEHARPLVCTRHVVLVAHECVAERVGRRPERFEPGGAPFEIPRAGRCGARETSVRPRHRSYRSSVASFSGSRPEASADDDHQHRRGGGLPDDAGDLGPHGVSGEHRAAERGAGERDGRAGPEADGEPVDDPGRRVLLVHDRRDSTQAGGDDTGSRRVAPDTEHDARPAPTDQPERTHEGALRAR